MKLRIQDNSLRFRLTQKEVARLRDAGRVEAEVRFSPDRTLRYAVATGTEVTEVAATYAGHCLCAMLPLAVARAWAESDEVTIEASGPVRILVEKDFQCLHRTPDRDPDAWPHPLAAIAE